MSDRSATHRDRFAPQNRPKECAICRKYHKRLEATEKYLIALQIIEMLPEENRSEQYGKLIDYIFENVDKQ